MENACILTHEIPWENYSVWIHIIEVKLTRTSTLVASWNLVHYGNLIGGRDKYIWRFACFGYDDIIRGGAKLMHLIGCVLISHTSH